VPRFLLRYFGEYLVARASGRSHFDAYRTIGFEREASRLAAERRARGDAAPPRAGAKIV